MKRNDWEFPFDTTTVLEAAQRKFDFHSSRVQYWYGLYEKAKQIYKDSVFVDDSFGGSNVTYRQVAVQGDSTAERQMADAKRKLDEHERKRDDYGAFVQALSSCRSTEVPLHYDDVVFFGLGAEVSSAPLEEEAIEV